MNFTKNDTLKLKGIAIIMMLFHHCFLGPERYEGHVVSFYPFPEPLINKIALSMKLCVCIFVFLSAYGMTMSFSERRIDSKSIASRYINMISGFIFVFLCLQIFSLVTGQQWYTKVYGTGLMSVVYFVIDFFGLGELFGTPMFIATFWYMSLAQVIIFIFPLMLIIYKKYGSLTLLFLSLIFSLMFPVTPENHMAYLPNYIVCISLGVISADKDLIYKINNYKNARPVISGTIKFFVYLGLIVGLTILRYYCLHDRFVCIFEALLPFLIVLFSYKFINNIPVIKTILKSIGVYSMNIFLIHNFIRVAWYYDFTYSFGYFMTIFLVLLVISYLAAVLIEKVKLIIKYDRLVEHIKIITKIKERPVTDYER